jgi:hypothetical protein
MVTRSAAAAQRDRRSGPHNRRDVRHPRRQHRRNAPPTCENADVRTFSSRSRITDAVLSSLTDAPHDGVVRPTLPSMLPALAVGRGVSTRNAAADLERFWPSRRGHAFDEFCR